MDTITTPLPGGAAPAGADAAAPPVGLKGVVVADTTVGDVRGAEGFFHYRQYSAVELARTRTFDDVWSLLESGRLPDDGERRAFVHQVGRSRSLPTVVAAALPAIARAVPSPLAGLSIGLGLVAGAVGLHPLLDLGPEARREEGRRIVAVVPTIVAALHRLRLGLEPLEPEQTDVSPSAPSWVTPPTTCAW